MRTDEEFAKMIKERMGEGAGIAYWEDTLKRSTPELFTWLNEHWEELGKDLGLLANHHEREVCLSLRRLGFDIAEGHLKGMLLVLEEIRLRVMATDTKIASQPIEIPASDVKLLPGGIITEKSSCCNAPIIHTSGEVSIPICSKCKQSAFPPIIG